MTDLITAWRMVASKDLIVSLEHRSDYDNALDDWYGKFTDSPGWNSYYVDRKLGILFCGQSTTTVETFTSEPAMNARMDELDELGKSYEEVWTPLTVEYTVTTLPITYRTEGKQYPPRFTYSQRTETTTFTTERDYEKFFGYRPGEEDIQYEIVSETRSEWKLEVSGAQVLATGLEHMYDRNTFRYQEFQAGYGHFPTKPWSECTDEEKAEHVKYMVSVYERANQYLKDYWSYIGVEATVNWKGEEIGSDSMWGLESDMDDETMGQYERELLSQAFDAALQHFESESKRYGVDILPPEELVGLAALSYDELKPLYEALKNSRGPWHPSWKGRFSYGVETQYGIHGFIDQLDDEERALYEGTELEGDEEHVES